VIEEERVAAQVAALANDEMIDGREPSPATPLAELTVRVNLEELPDELGFERVHGAWDPGSSRRSVPGEDETRHTAASDLLEERGHGNIKRRGYIGLPLFDTQRGRFGG